MKRKGSIYDQHGEHTEWLKKLFFYKDEIVIMQSHLEEVIKKYSTEEVKTKVEHFQNQLIIQNSTIEMLEETIEKDELELEGEIGKEHFLFRSNGKSHEKEINDLRTFEKDFNSLRKELNGFLSKYI